jgi:hypothetical protein
VARIDKVRAGEATWSAWWLDQLGHAGLGAIYSTAWTALALYVLPLIGINLGDWVILAIGAVLSLFGGILREVFQLAKSGKLHLEDRFYDAIFHIPGAIVPAVWLLVRWLT